jgi:ComF family protein
MWRTREIQNFVLSIIFPQFCLQCGKETNMVNLCPDCFATIEILEYWFCPVCGKRLADKGVCNNCVSKTNLIGIFSASPYIDPLVKKIIGYLKYEPYLKDLSKTLADLIITHFSLLNNDNVNRILQNSILVPVPSTKDRIRIRNFNQAEEIAKELSTMLNIPLANNVLFKIKPTPTQVGLPLCQRKQNIKNAFACPPASLCEALRAGKNSENLRRTKSKKILLVDDVFTTGATMEECAKTLKRAGAREIWAITAAREF